jgi:hypothetical protein
MKLLKLLSTPFILVILCSIAVKAQSDLKLPPLSGSIDSIQITVPGSGKLTPFTYKRNDSLKSRQLDSLKFIKKPAYTAQNAPVPIPNSFKPQQHMAAVAMPVLKIMLKKQD